MRKSEIQTLIVLCLALLVAQPLALVAGRWYLAERGSPGNAQNQWAAYRSSAAPDVLFVGDSRVRADIDTAELARSLSGGGRPATVGALGIDAAKPLFLRELVRRIAARETRPQLLVLSISEYQLNASWDLSPASGGSQTKYVWQITDPIDPAFMLAAARDEPDRGRLLAGWAFPLLASYGVVVEGLRCQALALRGREECGDTLRDRATPMTPEKRDEWREIIGRDYLGAYDDATRQIDAASEALAIARDAGIDVAVMLPPVYRFADIAAPAYARFLASLTTLSRNANAKLVDLHAAFDERPELFFDPNHLTTDGSRAVAPLIAASLGLGR